MVESPEDPVYVSLEGLADLVEAYVDEENKDLEELQNELWTDWGDNIELTISNEFEGSSQDIIDALVEVQE